MKFESKNVSPCRVRLIVSAPAEEITKDVNGVIGEYLKNSRIPGFRASKAPQQTVEHYYRNEIDADIKKRLCNRLGMQAIKDAALRWVEIVGYSDVLYSPATGISFVMMVDIEPEFKLPKYRSLPLEKKEVVVDEESIELQLDYFRMNMATYEKDDEHLSEKNDAISVTYAATCDGKPLEEIDENAKMQCSGTRQWFLVGGQTFARDFSENLKGLKSGDSKTFKVKFPESYAFEKFRNLEVEYALTVDSVEKYIPPVEEVMLEQLQCKTMEELRNRIRENFMQRGIAEEQERQTKEIADQLLKKADFPLPQQELNNRTIDEFRMIVDRLTEQGNNPAELKEHTDEIFKVASHNAQQHLRLQYILCRIAEEEQMTVEADEERDALESLAHDIKMSFDEVRELAEKSAGFRKRVLIGVFSKKALNFVVGAAKAK